MNNKGIVLIGNSGHASVVHNVFLSQNQVVSAYCEPNELAKPLVPVPYLGSEQNNDTLQKLADYDYFIAIGENLLRAKIHQQITSKIGNPLIARHQSSIVDNSVTIGAGTMIGANVLINPHTQVGKGVIANSGCIIEHECIIGDFAHIAPGTVLCGKVQIGENSLIGANSVIIPGIKIGKNVIIGAGSVVIKDVPDNAVYVGNPARPLK